MRLMWADCRFCLERLNGAQAAVGGTGEEGFS